MVRQKHISRRHWIAKTDAEKICYKTRNEMKTWVLVSKEDHEKMIAKNFKSSPNCFGRVFAINFLC